MTNTLGFDDLVNNTNGIGGGGGIGQTGISSEHVTGQAHLDRIKESREKYPNPPAGPPTTQQQMNDYAIQRAGGAQTPPSGPSPEFQAAEQMVNQANALGSAYNQFTAGNRSLIENAAGNQVHTQADKDMAMKNIMNPYQAPGNTRERRLEIMGGDVIEPYVPADVQRSSGYRKTFSDGGKDNQVHLYPPTSRLETLESKQTAIKEGNRAFGGKPLNPAQVQAELQEEMSIKKRTGMLPEDNVVYGLEKVDVYHTLDPLPMGDGGRRDIYIDDATMVVPHGTQIGKDQRTALQQASVKKDKEVFAAKQAKEKKNYAPQKRLKE